MKKFALLTLIVFLFFVEIFAFTKQGYYRWRNDDGSLITATAKADTNTAAQTVVGENIRLRVELFALATTTPNDIILSWSTDGSAWTQITDAATGHFQLSSTTYYDEQNTINDYLPNFMSMPHGGGYTIENLQFETFVQYKWF